MNRTKAPYRPALRYFGGKWKLAPWIISHFPRHEMDWSQHVMLLEKLMDLDGMVVISTYENELYNNYLAGDWHKVCRQTRAQAGNGKSNKVATECLWLSPAVTEKQPQQSLFQ